MKLIFNFLLISTALAESSGEKAAEEGGSALLVFLLVGLTFFVIYRWRGRRGRGKKTDAAAERVMARAAEPEAEDPPIVVKTYKGTRQEATRLFQTDAVELANLRPQSAPRR